MALHCNMCTPTLFPILHFEQVADWVWKISSPSYPAVSLEVVGWSTYALGFRRHWRYIVYRATSRQSFDQESKTSLCKTQGRRSKITLVETPVVQELKHRWAVMRQVQCFGNPRNYCRVARRLDVKSEGRPPTPGRLVTLRVKSETGDEVRPLALLHQTTLCPHSLESY